ncbi:Uncharacterised protein [Yersinia rohdei]|nr:hypothetical protein [Yersinia rohdei]CNF27865.1 Uncharacterised protein [Yersinia rohdei]
MDKHIDELSKADIDRVLNSAEIHYKKGSVVAGIVVRLISMLEATNERAKKAELELIKPLPIGELIHRLEGQTYRKWYDDDELNKMRERAEAA